MITSIFKKSTPINYSLMGILMVLFFFLYQFHAVSSATSGIEITKKAGILVILFASLFLSNFIVKKNLLTKDSSYTVLFYFIFLLFFPSVLNNINLLLANFFILLSMRRLVSLQTLKAPKEKIFDAALWIFVASLFHFWAILFIILVYISIIFHVSRDYRNWLIPFVALFTTSIIFVFYALLFDKSAINFYLEKETINLQLDYFTDKYQNIAFSIYAVFVVFFLFPFVFSLTNKPLNLQASYKKVLFAVFIGIVIFVISINKSNDLLIFTFLPMAIMATNTIEYMQNKIQQEIILFVSIACGLFCFFSQL
ncbi:DUF6427 family protein [Flavobacterium sp. SUN052]|uniref:DUF6427 family protein n=1 Tax=Flavobacterium sp. SUN052 TaxID=3002441 RepID=UPI00237DF1C4|nr:DUF6427 family protein [Flavobacterium sp. SUN052]MEC4003505.1 DUF6427 family protein [Flavobacterium sp. SUN052]